MKFIRLFALIWRHRNRMVLPLLALPIFAIIWTAGQPEVFKAITTLHIESRAATTPLLANINSDQAQQMLMRSLTKTEVIKDSLAESGMLLSGLQSEQEQLLIEGIKQNLTMELAGNGLVKLSLTSTSNSSIDELLEAISFNFISEVLAPERFRTEQQMGVLEGQIKSYSKQAKDIEKQLEKAKETKQQVALEFNLNRLKAQQNLSQIEYEQLLAKAKDYQSSFDETSPSAIMWFVEPPIKLPQKTKLEQYSQNIGMALLAGLLIGLLNMLAGIMGDSTLRREDEIKKVLGIKILGHMPDMGDVTIDKGRITAETGVGF